MLGRRHIGVRAARVEGSLADFRTLFKPASVSSLGNHVIPALAFGYEFLLQLDEAPA
jgi:hypothetical protein